MFHGRNFVRFFFVGIILIFVVSLTMAASYTNTDGADLDAASTTQTVTAAGEAVVSSITISIDFLKTDGSCATPTAGAPHNHEIIFSLTSPAGTTVDLIQSGTFETETGDSSGTVTMTFDDTADTSVDDPVEPETGTFRPIEALGTFNGEDANGDWTLYMEDDVGLDPLCVIEWTLNINLDDGGGPVAPTFTAGGDVEVLEDSGDYSAGWATDITTTGAAVFGADTVADPDTLFSTAPTVAADGTLTFTPADDEFGSATVTVILDDDTDLSSDPVEFTITITPVNDAPIVEGSGDVEVIEDSGPYSAVWATTLSPGPANESDQTLTITVELVDPADTALFAEQPSIAADGTLTFTPADETFGRADVTVTVQDDGGTEHGGEDTTIVTFELVILPVNDPPECDAAFADPDVLWPPNHRMVDILIGGITDIDSSIFTFVIDSVDSNEPENGLGDGNTAPDSEVTDTTLDTGEDTQTVAVRSERSGLGEGRTYTINFTVDDADFTPDLGDDFTLDDVVDGGDCSNSVQVFVPHDMRDGLTPPAAALSGLSSDAAASLSDAASSAESTEADVSTDAGSDSSDTGDTGTSGGK